MCFRDTDWLVRVEHQLTAKMLCNCYVERIDSGNVEPLSVSCQNVSGAII